MSRPQSRARQLSTSASIPALNDVFRRSRALTSSIISYNSGSGNHDTSRGRRESLTKEYKRRSISLDRASRFDDMIAQAGGVPRPTKVRRWDGNCRTTTNWDCLHKDPELWFSNGDCFVHFYGEQDSGHGPSLRLWLADIQSSHCRMLLHKLVSRPQPANDTFDSSTAQPAYDLYIPAPRGLRHEDTTNYHLTSRNFFAWMFEKPLVGTRLGQAMVSLSERMNEWRYDEEENEDDFLAFIDTQGYTDFRDCPDHALAVLHWAETYQQSDLWIDAFVHCTGMNEQLVASPELNDISLTTKAMITRANLDMAVRLDRASTALADFCESDSIINRRLNLSDSSLQHLEHFRNWLQGFYVQRHGYWPPHVIRSKYGKVRPLPKHTLLTMYADFRNLYQYLVNSEADPFAQPEVSRSVVDVLTTYDEYMKFTPLPHLIPQLPKTDFEVTELRRRKSSFSLFKSKKAKYNGKRVVVASALTQATNIGDLKVVGSSIVREYALFERNFTLEETERITATEARMARWVLIYSLLQILISVTNAAEEVRDVEGVDYPLCAQTAGCPPWRQSHMVKKTTKRRSRSVESVRKTASPESSNLETERERERPLSTTLSYIKPYTATKKPFSGPPPSDPLPLQCDAPRVLTQAEQIEARRTRSISKPSRIPVPIVLPKRPSTPKASRIPVPVFRSVSAPLLFEQIDTEDSCTTDYMDEDGGEQELIPTLPTRSSRRRAASSTLSPVHIPAVSPYNGDLTDESSTPPPLSARSNKRQTMFRVDSAQAKSSPEIDLARNDPSNRNEVLAMTPPESPFSRNEMFFDAHTAPAEDASPLHSVKERRPSQSQSSVVSAESRGRYARRMIDQHERQDSSTSGISDLSSEVDHRTHASAITTPSIYASHHFGDGHRKHSVSSSKDYSVTSKALPPLPQGSYTSDRSSHEREAEISPTHTLPNDVSQTLDVWEDHRKSTPRPLQITVEPYDRPTSSASGKDVTTQRDGTSATMENYLGAPPASAPPTVTSFRDGSTLQTPSKRRLRLFGSAEESDKPSNLALRRQGSKGLVALVSKSIVSKPLVSPALPTTPLTPMSFMSFESAGQSSRSASRAGTSFSSSRPGHVRQRSSELAQQFRQEIGWKRGAGWDEDIDNLIMGDEEGVVN